MSLPLESFNLGEELHLLSRDEVSGSIDVSEDPLPSRG
jgi:hypothetical protein